MPKRSPAPTAAHAHEADDTPRNQTRDLHHCDAPAGYRNDQRIALVVGAGLVQVSVKELAGLVHDFLDLPETGLRFTWQSKTLINIEIRGNGFSPSPSSRGGAALVTWLTRPSAGATTRPSRTGVTRGGSRKK